MTMDIQQYFQRFLANYTPYKKYWNYEDGCVLKGCIDLYHATGDVLYRDFVLDYVSAYVAADGSIPNYEMRQYNIDSINSGKALFFALEETGEERYRKAIEFHMQRLREHPRCQCGNFWHKQLYPNQIWLDGLYMARSTWRTRRSSTAWRMWRILPGSFRTCASTSTTRRRG